MGVNSNHVRNCGKALVRKAMLVKGDDVLEKKKKKKKTRIRPNR